MKYFFAVFFFISLSFFSQEKKSQNIFENIEVKTPETSQEIDMIADSINNNINYKTRIVEGEIANFSHRKKKQVGGFSVYVSRNSKNQLVHIDYNECTDNCLNYNYYFYNENLIKITAKKYWKEQNSITTDFYFKNNEILKISGTSNIFNLDDILKVYKTYRND